ncbi:MAG: cupin, partial [Sphaerobacteraceae bacterium]
CIVIPPGHDAWTVGDDPYVCIDLGAQIYEHLANGSGGQG